MDFSQLWFARVDSHESEVKKCVRFRLTVAYFALNDQGFRQRSLSITIEA